MHGVGVVYHLGALASVARSVENPAVSHAACATGTLNVLDAARKCGVRRVVYAASSSAYGGAAGAPAGQTEDLPVVAKSPYAAAKLAGELYMQAFAHTYGLETVRLRFFNIFGPRQRADSPYSGVIALFIAAMSEGRRPTIHGDGLQSRDFTYVANAVQALMKAAEAPEVSGNVYNVGTGRSVTVLDLVAALNRILGTDLKPIFAPTRAGDVKFSKADIRRTRHDLGYDPGVTFEDGTTTDGGVVSGYGGTEPRRGRSGLQADWLAYSWVAQAKGLCHHQTPNHFIAATSAAVAQPLALIEMNWSFSCGKPLS